MRSDDDWDLSSEIDPAEWAEWWNSLDPEAQMSAMQRIHELTLASCERTEALTKATLRLTEWALISDAYWDCWQRFMGYMETIVTAERAAWTIATYGYNHIVENDLVDEYHAAMQTRLTTEMRQTLPREIIDPDADRFLSNHEQLLSHAGAVFLLHSAADGFLQDVASLLIYVEAVEKAIESDLEREVDEDRLREVRDRTDSEVAAFTRDYPSRRLKRLDALLETTVFDHRLKTAFLQSRSARNAFAHGPRRELRPTDSGCADFQTRPSNLFMGDDWEKRRDVAFSVTMCSFVALCDAVAAYFGLELMSDEQRATLMAGTEAGMRLWPDAGRTR